MRQPVLVGVAAAVGLVVVTSCLKKDPLFCSEEKPCTDPARPFCDLTGEHPASDGHGNTCIPSPFGTDGGIADAAASDAADASVACTESIAFARGPSFGILRTVFTVNPDGTDLLEIDFGSFQPRWSPNATQLSYAKLEDGGFNLYVADRDGSAAVKIAGDGSFDAGISRWSPDGRYIAFEGFLRGDPIDVFVYEFGTGNLFNISNHPAEDFGVTWSPNSDSLLFVSERDGNSEIYRSTIEANPTLVNVTNNAAADGSPDWGPNDIIAFVSRRVVARADEIFSMNPDGSAVVQLSNRAGDDHGPRWNADGTKIAFVGGADELLVMNANGTGQASIATDLDPADSLDWGRENRIVYSKVTPNTNDNVDVYVIAADGSGEVRVTNDEDDAFNPTFSPCR